METKKEYKRYKNRKLYDKNESHYVKLSDILESFVAGIEVSVVDSNGLDITKDTLLKAIFESNMLERFKVEEVFDFLSSKNNILEINR